MLKNRSLTEGSVMKNILYFSLPYLLSYFLQTLYGLADLYIVSCFNGTESITAVSVGSQVMHMLTVMIVGLAMGATVSIGRAVGAKEMKKAARSVGNTVTVFMTGSVVVTALLLLLVRPIVAVMATPAEAVEGTVRYLTVCFIGIPFITAYNVISSVFRGLGDSKSPMVFIAVACGLNIGLDILFIGSLKMGPAGAALGTTLAQTVSVLTALAVVLKKKRGLSFSKEDFRLQKETVGPIFRVGVPVALQDGLIQIAFIVITVIANLRGLNDAAAVGIVEKVIGVLFLVPSSMLSAVSALAAQNLGALLYRRARATLRYSLYITAGFGLIAAGVVQGISPNIVAIFEENPEVIRLGGQYLKSYVWDCFFAGIHFCFSGYFCAMEKSGVSFLHNFLSIVLVRIPAAYLLSVSFPDTLYPMGWAAPAGSLLSVIVCVAAYGIIGHRSNWKKERDFGEKKRPANAG